MFITRVEREDYNSVLLCWPMTALRWPSHYHRSRKCLSVDELKVIAADQHTHRLDFLTNPQDRSNQKLCLVRNLQNVPHFWVKRFFLKENTMLNYEFKIVIPFLIRCFFIIHYVTQLLFYLLIVKSKF